MKYYKIVFSPTGGTEKVACALTATLNMVMGIDLTDAQMDYSKVELDEDSFALIAMPAFGGVAPQVALDRLAQIKANGAKCAVVAVYGNRDYESTLVQMQDYAQEAGFEVIAGVSAVARHSIVPKYGAHRPNRNDIIQLISFGEKIAAKIQQENPSLADLPGVRPYKESKPLFIPKAKKECVTCGLCVKKCPVEAIPQENPLHTDAKKCISCMRCIAICPVDARTLNPVKLKVASMAIKKACKEPKTNSLYL